MWFNLFDDYQPSSYSGTHCLFNPFISFHFKCVIVALTLSRATEQYWVIPYQVSRHARYGMTQYCSVARERVKTPITHKAYKYCIWPQHTLSLECIHLEQQISERKEGEIH